MFSMVAKWSYLHSKVENDNGIMQGLLLAGRNSDIL